VDEARLRLVAGDEYRATIFQLYRSLVSTARARGVESPPEQTAREFARTLRRRVPVSRDALRKLVELFETSRYSAGSVGAQGRKEAIDALTVVRAELRKGSEES
jgi:hypothetical protein